MNKKEIVEKIERNKIAVEYIEKQKILKMRKIKSLNDLISSKDSISNFLSSIISNNFKWDKGGDLKKNVFFLIPDLNNDKMIYPDAVINELRNKINSNDFVNIISFFDQNENEINEYKNIVKMCNYENVRYKFIKIIDKNKLNGVEDFIQYMINNAHNIAIILLKESLEKINLIKDGLFFVNSTFVGQEKFFIKINKDIEQFKKNNKTKVSKEINIGKKQKQWSKSLMKDFDILIRFLVYEIQNIFLETSKMTTQKELLELEEQQKKQQKTLLKNKVKLRNTKSQLEAEQNAIVNSEEGDMWI